MRHVCRQLTGPRARTGAAGHTHVAAAAGDGRRLERLARLCAGAPHSRGASACDLSAGESGAQHQGGGEAP